MDKKELNSNKNVSAGVQSDVANEVTYNYCCGKHFRSVTVSPRNKNTVCETCRFYNTEYNGMYASGKGNCTYPQRSDI